MQSKLTLRVEEAVIRKAKLLAKKRGTSVSRIFGDFIATQTDDLPSDDLPPVTASMLGAIRKRGVDVDEDDYGKHLEDKYL
ncbi:DUF6364 family protein [Puniceicoccaceae bacterium K14]|nr:DUF6364 family protein [Puniceicoccaceae bacterium K14]